MNKKEKQTRKKKILWDIFALFLIGWGILIFLSLFSFKTSDSGFFTTPPVRPVKNWGGIIGAFFSSLLFLALGKASYFIPVIFIMSGWYILIRKEIGDASFVLSGIFIFMITFAVLSSFSVIKGTPFDLIKSGGAVGLYISVNLKSYIGLTGLYIVSITCIFFSLMLTTNFSIKKVLTLFKDIAKGFIKIIEFFKTLFTSRMIDDVKERPPLFEKVVLGEEKSQQGQEPQEILEPKKEKPPVQSKDNIVVFKDKSVKKEKRSYPSDYKFPPLEFLKTSPPFDMKSIEKSTYETARRLESTFKEFDISAKVVNISRGPVITRYELQLAPGIKVSKVAGLADNIALSLASRVRIVAPVPGKAAVGVEVPNQIRATVTLGDILSMNEFQKNYHLIEIALGKDIAGHPVKINLRDCPHLLIAGATGSGKSVCLHSIVTTFLYNTSPDQLRFIMIDPKMVELKIYNGIPHLLTEVITNPKESVLVLKYLVEEMDRRYYLLDELSVRDIDKYNEKISKKHKKEEEFPKLPYIVVIIDEFADLMMTVANQIEDLIVRLAQKARAVGINLILATQRPSVDVITGIIKANFPSRIAFQVASRVDSRTIIDGIGSEKLLGRGDMLLSFTGKVGLHRIQGTFITEEEIEKIIDFIVENTEPIEYINLGEVVREIEKKEIEESDERHDVLYQQAREVVKQTKKASASYLQRRLKIGFNRAARIIEQMESDGLVGPQIGSKPREVYIDKL
ncbi:MAG: DNA translocase FtsK [Spirochaetes bacterium]|nr:DNA translocase FtsK [Spirochaetota bacterium]